MSTTNLTIAQIIETRIALDAKATKTEDERLVSRWLAEAFESTVPNAADALETVFADEAFTGSYGEAMRAAYELVTA